MFFIRHGESEFNAVFSGTGRDPGIADAGLTARGATQAKAAGHLLRNDGITRIICSPYTRALQTATLVGAEIGITQVTVTPLLGERALYSCDIGTHRGTLMEKWQGHDFAALQDDQWWPKSGETQESIARRVNAFMALHDAGQHSRTLVVSHWYFIFTLTSLDLENAEVVWRDPRGGYHKRGL